MEAVDMYAERTTQVEAGIVELKRRLKLHRKKQKEHEGNYGFVGDLGHVLELLKEVNEFLRPYEEKGVVDSESLERS